jgi:hypothetical protein
MMLYVRTLRRSTEIGYLLALGAFAVLGLLIFGVGVTKSSAFIIILGLLYAFGAIWYLWHVLWRVGSRLHLDTASNEIHWSAVVGRERFPLASVTSIRQTRQPDVFAFTLNDGKLIRFWHRNRHSEAQIFFAELQARQQSTPFDVLYLASKASWRRGLPRAESDLNAHGAL